jgi:hypothetical protein
VSGLGLTIGRLPEQRHYDAVELMRLRWHRIALEQAAAARRAGYLLVAEAFEQAAAAALHRPIGKLGHSPRTRERALALGREGVHYRAISADTGASCSTVRRWLAEAGIARRLSHEELSAIQREHSRRRWDERRGEREASANPPPRSRVY